MSNKQSLRRLRPYSPAQCCALHLPTDILPWTPSLTLFCCHFCIVFSNPSTHSCVALVNVSANSTSHSDFLLFMPAFNSEETLHAILSFYSLTSEGDSLVSDETLEGLGTSRSLLYILFGSVIRLFAPPGPDMRSTVRPVAPPPPTPRDTQGAPQSPTTAAQSILQPTSEEPHPRSIGGTLQDSAAAVGDARSSAMSALSYGSPTLSPGAVVNPLKLHPPAGDGNGTRDGASAALATEEAAEDEAALDPTPEKSLWKLTDFVPDPGYFLAGAIAGGVSRTATAPLDRLKVYLLVSTSTTQTGRQVVGAVKGGQPVAALKHITSPFATAIRDLWAAGGARTFFAGEQSRCTLFP